MGDVMGADRIYPVVADQAALEPLNHDGDRPLCLFQVVAFEKLWSDYQQRGRSGAND